MNQDINLLVAFWGGIVSFASPCVLPLLPSYLTFITGISFEDLKQDDLKGIRKATVLHSLAFIGGFTVVFVAMGALFGLLGETLFEFKDIIRRIGAVLIILFGIYITGLAPIPFLNREKKVHLRDKPAGYLGSAFVGITFAAGWSPCLGPIVGSILGLAMIGSSLNAGYGVLLLLVYSIGLGLPFFVSSLAFNTFLSLFNRFKRFIPAVNIVSGLILVAVGVFLLITDFDTVMNLLYRMGFGYE
ncbi:MAG: sulfite exporter TauE/SafE family protein [Deltaproteobacteria bacterium]|nr:sulfite exporter TauE/SafE family protein [Candidatus Zymogenaceae bacterium]